jgi:predicted permease
VDSLFGESAVGVLFVFNVGTLLAMWSLGVILLHGDLRTAWKKALNAPFLAVVVALIVNFTRLHLHIPGLVTKTVEMLGLCGIPMSILLIGAMMKDHFAECEFRSSFRVCWVSVALRIGLLPVVMIALARWLPCSTELKQVLLVQAAMPSAIFPVLIARLYGGNPVIATQVAIVTTLVSLGTIPLWLRGGAAFVGLDFVGE